MDIDVNLAITKLLIFQIEAEIDYILEKNELTTEDKKALYEYREALEIVRILEQKYESSKPIKGKNKPKKQKP